MWPEVDTWLAVAWYLISFQLVLCLVLGLMWLMPCLTIFKNQVLHANELLTCMCQTAWQQL